MEERMKQAGWAYLLAASLFAGCAHGGFHFEDDYLNPFSKNQDRFYSAGEQVDYKEGGDIYSLGNLIYTPSRKHSDATPEQLKNDRPYAGYTYLQYRTANIVDDTETTKGLSVGCVGQCSQSKWIQQTVHGLIGQKKPAWIPSDTLKSEPGVILEYEKRKILYGDTKNDLMFYGLIRGGNIVDSGSVGGTYRVGWNLTPFYNGSPIVFKLPARKSSWTAFGFTTLEERGVAYNQLLQGSLFQSEPHTVTTEPFVTEIDAGVSFGYGNFLFTYMWSRFSKEWKNGAGNFCFAGVNVEW